MAQVHSVGGVEDGIDDGAYMRCFVFSLSPSSQQQRLCFEPFDWTARTGAAQARDAATRQLSAPRAVFPVPDSPTGSTRHNHGLLDVGAEEDGAASDVLGGQVPTTVSVTLDPEDATTGIGSDLGGAVQPRP